MLWQGVATTFGGATYAKADSRSFTTAWSTSAQAHSTTIFILAYFARHTEPPYSSIVFYRYYNYICEQLIRPSLVLRRFRFVPNWPYPFGYSPKSGIQLFGYPKSLLSRWCTWDIWKHSCRRDAHSVDGSTYNITNAVVPQSIADANNNRPYFSCISDIFALRMLTNKQRLYAFGITSGIAFLRASALLFPFWREGCIAVFNLFTHLHLNTHVFRVPRGHLILNAQI